MAIGKTEIRSESMEAFHIWKERDERVHTKGNGIKVMCMAQMIDVAINVKVCTGIVTRHYYVCCHDGNYAERIKSLELLVENHLTSDQLVNSMVHAPLVCTSMSLKMDMWK